MSFTISIILSFYNARLYLEKAVLSVLEQNFSNWEIIAINDASTDESRNILRDLTLKSIKIRVFDFDQNKGVGYSRNFALNKAKGEYIMFLDSDDLLSANALSTLSEVINKHVSNDVFIWGYNTINSSEKIIEQRLPSKTKYGKLHTPFYLGMMGLNGFSAYPWVYGVKKSFILDHNIHFAEGIFFEDILFTTQMLYYAKKVKVIKKPLYNYRKHGTSITGKSSKQKIDDKFSAFIGIKSFLQEKGVFQQYEQLYLMRFLALCVHTSFIEYFTLPKTDRDEELDMYMLKIRQSKILRKENLMALRNLGLSLPKEEKHARKAYLGAYYGLKAIKNEYHMHRIMVRVLVKLNRLRMGIS